ncbi:hypothetical protein P7K49_037908, partial [Saguinus oedipus]
GESILKGEKEKSETPESSGETCSPPETMPEQDLMSFDTNSEKGASQEHKYPDLSRERKLSSTKEKLTQNCR